MTTFLIRFIAIFFTCCSFGQEHTEATGKDSYALSYLFSSSVTNDSLGTDNRYTRTVEIYSTRIDAYVLKYDFFCTNIEIKGPNNLSYIKKVAYVFDEISLLVDADGKIIDVSKPADMDQRWEKTKEKILLEYKGELITNYLNKIDRTIEDKEQLKAFFQSDAMYGLLLKAYSSLDHPVNSSKIIIKEKGEKKVITPTSTVKKETEQYTFKGDVLEYAVKTVPNIKYEVKFVEEIKL